MLPNRVRSDVGDGDNDLGDTKKDRNKKRRKGGSGRGMKYTYMGVKIWQ